MNIGHSHPKVVAAIKSQAEKFTHTCFMINPYEAANIHTTDASLLIPTPALDRFYYVVSYPQTLPSARGSWDLPAAINIVATQDNTVVTVTSSTNTRAGGPVPARKGVR